MKNFIKTYTQPAFLICVAVLAVSVAAKSITIEWMGLHLTKQELPLKKPLENIDEQSLAKYRIVGQRRIKNKDIIKQLGTDQYVTLELEDTDASPYSPVRFCSLAVYYYTGDLGNVAHVPEECYIGAGKKQLAKETITLKINGLDGSVAENNDGSSTNNTRDINAKYLVFGSEGSNMFGAAGKESVLYLFKVNGVYSVGRNETRAIMSKNFLVKYAYFSKVEWRFYGRGVGGLIFPDKEETVKASEKMLSVLLPVVEKEHWPDWEKAKRQK